MLVVIGSLYETSGNQGAKSGFGVLVDVIVGLDAHYVYFNPISGCDSIAPAAASAAAVAYAESE